MHLDLDGKKTGKTEGQGFSNRRRFVRNPVQHLTGNQGVQLLVQQVATKFSNLKPGCCCIHLGVAMGGPCFLLVGGETPPKVWTKRPWSQLSNEKKPGCLGDLLGMMNYPVILWGLFHKYGPKVWTKRPWSPIGSTANWLNCDMQIRFQVNTPPKSNEWRSLEHPPWMKMYFLFSLSQWLTFWTFGDSIFGRKNKVQTFISWPFGWVNYLKMRIFQCHVSFQVNISTMCLYPALQVLHSILTWLAGKFVFRSFTRKCMDMHWIKPPPSAKWSRVVSGSPKRW